MQLPQAEKVTATPARRGAGMSRWLAVLVSVAALAGTYWAVGARALFSRVEGVRPGWLVLGIAITVLQFVIMTIRWRFIAARLGVPLSFARALGEYYLSALLNYVLPVGVVGDALRIYRHADRAAQENDSKRPVAPTALAVVLERGSGQVGLWVFVVAAGPWWWRAMPIAARASHWWFAAVALVLVTGTAAAAMAHRRLHRRYGSLLARGARVMVGPAGLVVHLGLSLLLMATHIVLFLVSARALGLTVPLRTALGVVPPVMVAATVVTLFGGFGTREAAAAALYQALGLDPAEGAAIFFIFGAISLVAATPGLLVTVWQPRR
jgi:uncharacterized membrane protein YbhN (UPF0104 family)